MAIKNLSYTGKQLDESVELYVSGKRNVSKAVIESIHLKAGKIAVGSTGDPIYGESTEYSGESTISPSVETQIIEAAQYNTKDIVIDNINLQEKSVDSAQVVVPDEGYYLSKVTIAGKGSDYIGPAYVNAIEKTYKPGTANQIIMGPKLFMGKQTILGDINLTPKNIGKGISIFGIMGTYAGDYIPEVAADGKKWDVGINSTSVDANLLCYGNGKYVAITENSNTALYSTDGTTWVKTTLPHNVKWSSVCYGNGKFVAIAKETSNAAYSLDGITWTSAESYSSIDWSSVCYGGGIFVAVANGSAVSQYSLDGTNWLYASINKSASWSSVCYADNKFIAVANDGNLAYSYDGEDWKILQLEQTKFKKIYHANDMYIALVENTNKCKYSYDGFNWSDATIHTTENDVILNAWVDICYGNGKFVIIGNNNTAAYSMDGINWTAYTSNTNINSYIIYGNNKFIMSNKTNIYYSNTTLDV